MIDQDKVRERLEKRRRELLVRQGRAERDLQGVADGDSEDREIAVRNSKVLEAIAKAAADEVADIEEALLRLSRGTYGICKHCSQPIAPRRLAAMPEAITCHGCSYE